MVEAAIRVERVCKSYRVATGKQALLENVYRRLRGARAAARETWALRDVSFEVERGESLAVVGANGAGKSTLLKILAGIATPTSGRIALRLRVSTQLAHGAGFHPYLSGRENVFLQGTILGLTNAEVARLFPEIVEFAGLEAAIDRPLWTYSNGMVARLGFAVAAHADFECLLLDEALSAGDVAFRERCQETLQRIRASGATVVMVSHASRELRERCDRALWLEQGRVRSWGPVDRILDEYEAAAARGEPRAPRTAA